MIRRRLFGFGLATITWFGARAVMASPITLTGNVENDFNPTNPDVRVLSVLSDPTQAAPKDFMIQNGWVSGWAIKDVRVAYDGNADTLYVGFNTFKNGQGLPAIVGDADGNGDPGGASAQMTKAGGVEWAHLGGYKSVSIAMANNDIKNPAVHGAPVIVAGVPADKTAAGPGIDGFTVAKPLGPNGVAYNFGKSITDAQGNPVGALAFDPSKEHPGFEFTIKKFSQISGVDPTKGFWLSAFAGAPDDVIVGSTALPFTRVPAFSEQNIPEPGTLVAWSLVAAGAAVGVRRRSTSAG